MVTLVPRHLDIPAITPPRSPGILDQVVVPTTFASVSYSKDGVVEPRGAEWKRRKDINGLAPQPILSFTLEEVRSSCYAHPAAHVDEVGEEGR